MTGGFSKYTKITKKSIKRRRIKYNQLNIVIYTFMFDKKSRIEENMYNSNSNQKLFEKNPSICFSK